MIRRLVPVLAAVVLVLGVSAPAHANPGPGNSHSCAPGQHGNDDPGWKPPACD